MLQSESFLLICSLKARSLGWYEFIRQMLASELPKMLLYGLVVGQKCRCTLRFPKNVIV